MNDFAIFVSFYIVYDAKLLYNIFAFLSREEKDVKNLSKKKHRLEYKWVITVLSFLMVMTVLGFCSSSKSIFISAVCDALDFTRSGFSLNETARYISTATVNVFFGALIYKYGAKKLICAGFISLIASMLIYSLSTSIFGFVVGGVFLGIGLSFTTTTMVGAIVNKWWKKNNGTVMGLVLASNGIGSTVAIQILTPVIHASDPFAYRNAYRLVAIILSVVFLLILVFFKNEPKSSELNENARAAAPEKKKTYYKSVLKTPYFYLAAICIFISGMVLQSMYGITAPLLEDAGIGSNTVANVLSVASMMLFVTKFGIGFIYDRTGIRATISLCYACSVIAVILLLLVSAGKGSPLAFVYAVVVSIALPLETIMLPIYAKGLFDEKSFNTALGLFVSVNTAGYATGAPLANLCYDLSGSYKISLIVSAVIMVFALVLMHFVITIAKRKRKRTQFS